MYTVYCWTYTRRRFLFCTRKSPLYSNNNNNYSLGFNSPPSWLKYSFTISVRIHISVVTVVLHSLGNHCTKSLFYLVQIETSQREYDKYYFYSRPSIFFLFLLTEAYLMHLCWFLFSSGGGGGWGGQRYKVNILFTTPQPPGPENQVFWGPVHPMALEIDLPPSKWLRPASLKGSG
jgi:hypothetical protein